MFFGFAKEGRVKNVSSTRFLVLLIAIMIGFSFISCKNKKTYILDCYIKSDKIVLELNANNGIGKIQGGGIGSLEFAKDYTENFEVIRNEDVVTILIDNTYVFENGEDYKIEIQWYGGGVKVWSKFDGEKFEFITKESLL